MSTCDSDYMPFESIPSLISSVVLMFSLLFWLISLIFLKLLSLKSPDKRCLICLSSCSVSLLNSHICFLVFVCSIKYQLFFLIYLNAFIPVFLSKFVGYKWFLYFKKNFWYILRFSYVWVNVQFKICESANVFNHFF